MIKCTRLAAAAASGLLVAGMATTGAAAASPARAATAAQAIAATPPPLDGACNYWQNGFFKVVGAYLFQCQWVKGLGWFYWVLVGYAGHCSPVIADRPGTPGKLAPIC